MNRLFLFITLLFTAQANSAANTFNIEAIDAHSYLLMQPEYGTRMALLHTPQGFVLVDPMPGEAKLPALSNLIQQSLLPSKGKLVGVINTHSHQDHAGGNSVFVSQSTPLITTDTKLPGLSIVPVRSHSQQDLIVYHQASNHIFVGDLFTSDWHPTFYAGGRQGFIHAMQQIQALGNRQSVIVPGHGQPSNKVSLAQFERHTLQWFELISEWQEKGKTAKQIMQIEAVQRHLQGFNLNNEQPFVPPKAFKRFIQRTLTMLAQEKRALRKKQHKQSG